MLRLGGCFFFPWALPISSDFNGFGEFHRSVKRCHGSWNHVVCPQLPWGSPRKERRLRRSRRRRSNWVSFGGVVLFRGLVVSVGIQRMTGRTSKEWLSKRHFQFFNCSQDHLEPFLLHPMWLCQGYMPRPKIGWAALAQEDPCQNLIGRLSQRLWVPFVQLIENFCMSGTVQRVPGFRKDKYTVHIVERKWHLRRFKSKTFYEW